MLQRSDIVREEIKTRFLMEKEKDPQAFERRIDLSWSNWGFGIEPLEQSMQRLAENNLDFIELHGNHYGDDLGYDVEEVKTLLTKFDMKVSGVCGMFNNDNDLSSNRPIQRQEAINYIRREAEFTAAVGGSYMLVVPGSVGRPDAYDSSEFYRSVDSLRRVASIFEELKIKAAIEPIRAAEVSFVHTVKEAIEYIEAVDMPGVQYINGDIFHMLSGETNMATAVLEAGERLVNLHMADTNRCALGDGALDLDTLLMAMYLIGFNRPGHWATPEPLGPGAGPYPAMNEKNDPKKLDILVKDTVDYFREREEAIRNL
ncbi:MAG: sugar phosphate isomerase/epimerase [Actinomycetaceae bacterium]|nr:sugar phosphate isomerase/epimerase [Actinomycetaceae bacterium]